MTFSTEWDQIYTNHLQLSIWPWSDLISLVYRTFRPLEPGMRVLELGFGAGANIPFFLSLQANYFGIEGSSSVVDQVLERFPHLKEQIIVGDFTRQIPFSERFHLIVDRSSLTHNSESAIRNSLSLIQPLLAPGGKFIGIDWFSTEHSDHRLGEASDDPWTLQNFKSGQFRGVGKVHFSDKDHLKDLFQGFQFLTLEHKSVRKENGALSTQAAYWNFVVECDT